MPPNSKSAAAPPAVAALLAAAAALLPTLPILVTTPSPTFFNQAMAFALWPAFLLGGGDLRGGLTRPAALLGALTLLALAAAGSSVFGALPAPFALSALATLFAAAVMVAGGAGMRRRADAQHWFAAFSTGLVACGVVNIALALIQVFLPDWCDGDWIATSSYPGRAVGNLRQPNHLSSLLLWHCIAVIALFELGRLRRWLAVALLALGVYAVVLTASRTGLVSVVLLAVWGLFDRRLSKPARYLLLAAPLVYALAWQGMAQWAALSQHAFGGTERLAETDISSSRFAIWRDTLALIRQQPWFGVGWGEFNIAWTLTPSPQRPVAFFDHTHNLPLQLAVELGLPLAALVLGLLLWALWQAASRAWRTEDAALGTAQRCAVLMVVMIGLHSLLEYPLWYSYFLLPAAWAFGFALQGGPDAAPQPPASAAEPAPARINALVVAALVLAGGAVMSVLDYWRVVVIFSPGTHTSSLESRVASGQRSIFFAHHADYAAVTSDIPQPDPDRAFDRAPHYLLDTRLMMTWARALAARGRIDEARHLAARLREFRKADAEEFFKDCPAAAQPPAPGLPFQCELPQRTLNWRDFLRD